MILLPLRLKMNTRSSCNNCLIRFYHVKTGRNCRFFYTTPIQSSFFGRLILQVSWKNMFYETSLKTNCFGLKPSKWLIFNYHARQMAGVVIDIPDNQDISHIT